MKKINSYMSKIGLVQGDEIKVQGNDYIVNCDGYLVKFVGNIGVVDIETTANVLFRNYDFEYTNVNAISENDYNILLMLDNMKFKNIMFDGKELFASKYDIKKLERLEDGGIDYSTLTKIFAKNDRLIHSVPFLTKDEETKFADELCYKQFYSVKFLLKRYKNRVLQKETK